MKKFIQTQTKNNINDVIKVNTCCGCSACANICPAQAIKMQENEVGYYVPNIDVKKCINCSKCNKICPELNRIEGNKPKPDVYAAQAKDEIRFVSSSGGAFTLIAEEILSRNGYVVGAAFDEKWKVQHTIISDLDDLDKLRRSKYVQSYIREDLYKDIKKLLEQNNYVLFSGCPCQVAGLKSYLNKDYDKLILIDLLCAHSASPKAYRKFLNDNYPGENIKDINFRSKIKGWDAHTVVITDKHLLPEINPNFMSAYVKHLLMNECCKTCKYTTTSRQGDITLGDYWGIAKRAPHLDDRKGTSCMLVSTEKGRKIISKIKHKFILLEKRSIKDALKSNWVLRGSFPANPNIARFNKDLESLNFQENTQNCLSSKYNVGIMGWFWLPNRGAILTNYALNEAIKELGYNVKTINFIPSSGRKNTYKNSIAEKFTQKHISLTHIIISKSELKSLNNSFSTFIVGSDQLWRWCFRKYPLGHLFLNFANINKKIISYSTSFGVEKYDGPEEARMMRKFWLKRFDYLSVREYDGVKVLNEDFGISGEQVIDPVFLIDKQKYENIIKESDKTDKNFIAYYMILPTKEKMNIVHMAEKKYGIKSVDIKGNLPIEDWLYYIKNCKILITDSFHGTCFATIFNKNFISINVCDEKPTRFETILKITGMMDRLLLYPGEIKNKEYLFNDIDYSIANARLIQEVQRSKKWLQNSLEAPKRKIDDDEKMFETLIEHFDNELENTNKKIYILNNKYKIYLKYYRAKLLFNLTKGKIKNNMKKNKEKYKQMVRIIRNMNTFIKI